VVAVTSIAGKVVSVTVQSLMGQSVVVWSENLIAFTFCMCKAKFGLMGKSSLGRVLVIAHQDGVQSGK
jgi:hypothetical protein